MGTKPRQIWLFAGLAAACMILFAACLTFGPVHIPAGDVMDILTGRGGAETNDAWSAIVLDSRLPRAVTAIFAGAALAVSGLLLQTLFRNPLAGPSILGVSDGANLGVALVMLCGAGALDFNGSAGGYLSVIVAAFAGSGAILALMVYFADRLNNSVMLLIVGIMTGYLASSVISILNYSAAADQVHQFVMWGMGDFSTVSTGKLPWFCSFTAVGTAAALLLTKPLNALLLGDSYAANLGVDIRRTRISVLLSTGLLTATVTAFCGPISFIGLAVPHIARLLLGSADHTRLIPATILCGSFTALLCNLLTSLPAAGAMLPMNAVTPLIGAPVIIFVILNRRNLHYFN